MSVCKSNLFRSDKSEVKIVCRNSPLTCGEDLVVPGVPGEDRSIHCLHCVVNTCAVVLGKGGI